MRLAEALDQVRAAAPPPVQWAHPHEGTVLAIDAVGRAIVHIDDGPVVTATIARPYGTIVDDGDTVHDHDGQLTPPAEGTVTGLVRVLVVFAAGDQDRAWVVGRA